MNQRRHPFARAYAAAVIFLRVLIPLAWIAAVVWATISLPDLASAPTAPLEALAPKNGAASQAPPAPRARPPPRTGPPSQAQARATKRFGFPLSTETAVVQRNAQGLPRAT